MGYELDMRLELSGEVDTYLEDFKCEVEFTEVCDDQGEPASIDISMTKMLDTNQAQVAKEVIGYDDECDKLLKTLHEALKAFPRGGQ